MRHSQSRPGRRRPWILNRDKAYSDASSERAAEIDGGAAQRPADGVFDGQRRGTETETNPQLSGLDEIGNPGIPGGLRRSGLDGQREHAESACDGHNQQRVFHVSSPLRK
jgi:hypothetical protein